jgi:IS5 family transposase
VFRLAHRRTTRKLKSLKKHPRINKIKIRTEYLKASLRAKVEHPFRIIKFQFGF